MSASGVPGSVLALDDAPAALIAERVVTGGDPIGVVDPFTDRQIGVVHQAGAALVDEAVATAVAALPGWSRTPVARRAAVLRATADLVEHHGATIAATVTAEMGMPTTLAVATQHVLPAAVLRATADAAERFPWQQVTDGTIIRHVAGGVVAAITPWNMPVHQIVAKVASAVAAGCTVVLKPSEATPFDAALVRRCFIEAGLPAGVLSIVHGTGSVTGQALSSHPDVAHVSFTGSVRGGQAVAAAAAASLSRTTLELGGKSPAVVLPDADLDAVVPRVLASGLVNSGQACNATGRLVLPAAHAARVEALIAQSLDRLVFGDPTSPETTHGPLASAAHAERVLGHIGRARRDGGRVVAGTGEQLAIGASRSFISPIVVTDLAADSSAVQEEIFGPVLVVQYYRDVEEAIEVANDSRYGLSAEVWSADRDRAIDVANHLEVGQVKVNGVRTRERPTAPFGGIKWSGHGRELGTVGIAEFTEIMAVMA
ncbi:aldehyde dehydrogenase family protein [Gordonia sp. NB41Y]|uniref:aldehyde dehydrogenase family protein n=1 Tax=Gordonia sp. NB41Y TaxID=875808 RepID=UPI0006B165F2|nr:aldehyde dehydrogenase family protein [Gordonia sp. NB41Y]KOY49605.1 aldehyde dehydrogenase [Gordonia sp. NB41Y]WLP88529.1 aldehyde dehydrogenase family protein [Gordonia sp. NB41Y]